MNAPPSSPERTDAYEAQYMPADAIYRHKAALSARTLALLVIALPAGLGALGAAVLLGVALAGALPWFAVALPVVGAGALAGLLGALLVPLGTVRIAVDAEALHLHIGASRRVLRHEDVESLRMAPTGSRRYGIGVRRGLRGRTLYTLLGDPLRPAPTLTMKDGRVLVLVCKEPDALHAALQRARAGLSRP